MTKYSAFIYSLLLSVFCLFSVVCEAKSQPQIEVGASQFSLYQSLLAGKKVGVVVNQTSRVGSMHLVDFLQQKGIDVRLIFAPEHGFRGDHDAGEKVNSSTDLATGLPIISIYGKHKKPDLKWLHQLDVVIFDIQDVGVRFYTYISSMHYMMQASAQTNTHFIVLDRPNPNIAFVDGFVLDPQFRSFVGMHPIPILHGMTVGELAKMIAGEGWLNLPNTLKLSVIPVKNYRRNMQYPLPVKPSPNLPNSTAVRLYPSLCFFEATPISIGRGTDFPFQIMGYAPLKLGEFSFTPRAIKGAAANPKFKNRLVWGQDFRNSQIAGLNLQPLLQAHQQFKQHKHTLFTRTEFMDKLAGTDKLRKAIEQGKTEAQIRAMWQAEVAKFKTQRKPYLLYE